MEIASRIADVLCGGQIERGSTVDEQWLLDLERKAFRGAGADAEDAGATISLMLKNGKQKLKKAQGCWPELMGLKSRALWTCSPQPSALSPRNYP